MSILVPSFLDTASRSDLIARAEALGIERADVLTRTELVDEIVKRTVADPVERRLARGLLGVARDLVARVVERGLHLPDAAALIRGLQQATLTPVTPPIATVTLAEIYAGQGHRTRALTVLDEVLANEPDHGAARRLREKIAGVPEDAMVTVPPSEPPPEIDATADHGLDVDREAIAEAVRDRDTLPPEADSLPTIAPDDLPPRDRVVLAAVDATSALARWEIRQASLDEAFARARGGEGILRVVAVTPSWDGPTTEVRDSVITAPTGAFWVCDLPPSAVLRAAVGWRGDKGFDPLAVALDVVAEDERETGATTNVASSYDAVARACVHPAMGIEERALGEARQGKSEEGSASSSWRALALAPCEAPYEAFSLSVETR